MFARTFIRTLLNYIFKNNIVANSFVKIYCKTPCSVENAVKFRDSLSIHDLERKNTVFFQSVTGDKIDCK